MNVIKKILNKILKIGKRILKKSSHENSFAVTILLLVGIIAVLNFISFNLFARFDLTENKDYSISQVTKKTVRNLDDIVNIKVYFSKNLAPTYLNLEKEIADVLEEYTNYSGGKVKVEFINPADLKDPENELAKVGIPTLQFNILKNDSYEIVKGYMGILMQYGDNQEAIPMIDSSVNLEYRITTLIKKLTNSDKKTIGLVSSHQTFNAATANRAAYGALEDLYNVIEVDLKMKDVDLSAIDTLIFIGPKEAFVEEDLRKIDDFVLVGKPVIFLVDGVVINSQVGAQKNEIGLDPLFNKYGLKLNKDLVSDTEHGQAQVPNGPFSIVVEYNLWPKIKKENFDKNNVMVASLETLILPWASDIELLKENIKEGTEVSILAASTENACTQENSFDISIQGARTSCKETKQRNLAVYLKGEVDSLYNEGKTGQANIILVGDSDFVSDQFLSQGQDNLIFFQNLVDGVTLDEDLINIRSQGVTDRPLKDTKKTTKEVIRYFNIFGLTVIVLAFGLVRYFFRRKKSFVDEI